ncbi:helix-turn-helix domain-containing protein [Alkalitalea saponilacus]|uniref:Transcriptional regulator, XRE family n=1 Tax=Alkalitalea saponilacus TaxID=889453 RepID=A0A1T5BRY8_9BACT|nr:helix-turn-helix transcriptional regulator [Alkalitalea saponilacus]ASB49615.1 transcriptional regulator [Alkalitalea saponilacus]SKB49996.1 transcriptional regulator, XRE family [Alkalitalea saponilacus]
MTDKSFDAWNSMSDKALADHIGSFVRHHRMEMNKTQDELATAAGISRSTLSLLERGETVTVTTLLQVLRVLDQLQVLSAFEVRETLSPLALAKLQKEKRQRARGSSKKKANPEETDW